LKKFTRATTLIIEYWLNQDVMFGYTAVLVGTRDQSVHGLLQHSAGWHHFGTSSQFRMLCSSFGLWG